MMFLTDDEVKELTRKSRRASQAKVLNSLGITHKIRPDGSLVILRSHVEQVFAGRKSEEKPRLATEPNWDAFADQQAEYARKEEQRAAKKERINQERARRGLPPLR
ncbi:DUF4224 domain-containing protein [Massilia sp. Root335]|uniref:DUF4224 domain-containing protein n=1 Tax=Massilia sp. Root335 TaxID=1736517 RepID=UPI0006F96943|nr:DUF4224 domain-containing protein [Massilia sp. Root335]KQV50062.1 hypothetical protein ASC93_11110 [Massilia sp. Root335]